MLPFTNFALLVRQMQMLEQRDVPPQPPETRTSLIFSLIPITAIVAWAAVLLLN